jgi:glutathione S-transferase
MSAPILHHYPGSPFAEKVRLMLGFKGLAWQSVTIPRVLPKPDLMPLTGGYRKTPVMQFGADIFCDSACIARELERRSGTPALFPGGHGGRLAIVGAWADSRLFLEVVGVVFGTLADSIPADLKADRHRFSDGLIDLDRFKADQSYLRSQVRSHLFWIEHALDDDRAFLDGAAPTYADFCCYAPLWMLRHRVPELRPLDDMPRTVAWMDRIAAIGHGSPADLDAKAALAIAHDSAPDAVMLEHPETTDGFLPGVSVTVAADDYGKDAVAGTLVALSAQRVVIRRSEPLVGEVNVHFPRAGFRVAHA